MVLFSVIASLMRPARPAAHDILIRRFLAACLVALGRHAPRRLRMIALGATLTAAVGMVYGVHRNSTHVRTFARPARAARLAHRNILVFEIADLTDGGATIRQDHPLLARGQLEQGEFSFLCHKLRLRARAPREFGARARLHLDRVDEGAQWDVPEPERVAGFDVGSLTRLDRVAN